MAMPVPQKIVLKSSTSISLNDRFTMISKQQRIPPSAQTVRVQMAAQQQASAKNQRLALQMANRPSVQAALGNQDQGSVLERLGSPSVLSRLGGVPRGRGRGRSRSWRGRGAMGGGMGGMRGGRPGGGRGMIDNREMTDTYQFQPGYLGRGRGMARGQGGPGRGRGRDFSVFRGRGRSFRGRPLGRGRGGRGRGSPRGSWTRQRGRGRGSPGTAPTREYLDNQLDEYMARQPGDVTMMSDK